MRTDGLVAQARFASPLGPLTAAATAKGLAGLWFDGQAHHPGPLDAPENPRHPVLAQARRQLEAYWKDAGAAFSVPLDLQGTDFQQKVWRALLRIRPGSTSTYAAIAARAGSPAAVRAAGAAIGRNPVSIIVPCHRVLGRDGSLTGYAGGLERKQGTPGTGRCAFLVGAPTGATPRRTVAPVGAPTAAHPAVGINSRTTRPSAPGRATPSAAVIVGATSSMDTSRSAPPGAMPGPAATSSPSARCSPVRW